MITHYQCLRAICNTQTKTHRNLLHINGKIDIHTQEIQILMTEIYKCPLFTWDYYNKKSNHFKLRGKQFIRKFIYC